MRDEAGAALDVSFLPDCHASQMRYEQSLGMPRQADRSAMRLCQVQEPVHKIELTVDRCGVLLISWCCGWA